MNVFNALKLIQFDHQPLNHQQVVITDANGKPDAQLSELLADCSARWTFSSILIRPIPSLM